MNYDFDLLSLTPREIQAKYAELLKCFGLTELASCKVAMFRDPETVRILRGASETVRECFVSSGFALNGYDSGAARNEYASEDENERKKRLVTLQENVEDLPGDVDWNGFDIADFFVAAYGAMPAPRKRQTLVSARRAVLPPVLLKPAHRIASRILSRPISTSAPGI